MSCSARSSSAVTSPSCSPYESLVARLGAHASDAPKLGASAPDLFECDAVIARIIPNGSLEQIIYRVDALHWLEDAGVARRESSARDRAYGRQVLHLRAARARRTRNAANRRVRARGGCGRSLPHDGRRHRQAAVRLDGTRHGPRERRGDRMARLPRAGSNSRSLLSSARNSARGEGHSRVRHRRPRRCGNRATLAWLAHEHLARR